MADPKLVEALDRLDYLHELAATTCRDEADGELVDGAASVVRAALASRVQLPEEPWGWEWEASDGIGATWGRVPTQRAAVVRARNAGCGTGRIRPVYVLPGDPEEASNA